VKIGFEAHGADTLVIPVGRLDSGAATGFQARLEHVLAGTRTAPAAVIIDCAGLEYVSTPRTARISTGCTDLGARGPQIRDVLAAAGGTRVFELSGCSRVIAVHTDRAAAVAPLPQGAA
jgi:anti-anti-sigma regulatory factor